MCDFVFNYNYVEKAFGNVKDFSKKNYKNNFRTKIVTMDIGQLASKVANNRFNRAHSESLLRMCCFVLF